MAIFNSYASLPEGNIVDIRWPGYPIHLPWGPWRLGVPVAQLRYTHRQRLMHILSHDILHRVDWTNLNCVETLIQTAWQAQELMTEQTMPSHVDEVPKTYFPCSWCSLQFDSLPNLRRHQTHVHGCPQLRTFQVTVASHAKNGLPICTTCHKTFSTWRRFTIHLERNCCQAMQAQHGDR